MFSINEYEDKFKMYELRDEKAGTSVRICPERGGIVTSFEVNGEEVFYLDKETFYDEGKNIRGGNPVLFPLCGQLPDETYRLNGKSYRMKNHGFARSCRWEVLEKRTAEEASIKIGLKSDQETLKSYPFEFKVEFEYVLRGNTLEIRQNYINDSDEKMPISAGFHPYFYAENKSAISYKVNSTEYFDNEDKKIKECTPENLDLSNSRELKLLLDHKGNEMSFYLGDLGRKITFDYSDEFKYIVLWSSPGSNFICVEPWTSKIGALNTGQNLIEVEPKNNLRLTCSITVE